MKSDAAGVETGAFRATGWPGEQNNSLHQLLPLQPLQELGPKEFSSPLLAQLVRAT